MYILYIAKLKTRERNHHVGNHHVRIQMREASLRLDEGITG